MKRSKFSEDQIVRILQEGQSGQIRQTELCRKHGISPNTFYVWKRKYSGMQTDDVRRLRELEAENAALKRIVANQALELDATAKLLRKNGFRPPSAGRGPSS
jgi:putative transposase